MGAAFLAVGLLLAPAAALMSEAGGTFTAQTLVGGNTFATADCFLEGAIVRRVPHRLRCGDVRHHGYLLGRRRAGEVGSALGPPR